VKILPDLGEPQHRLGDPSRQHVERDQLTNRQVAFDHQMGAEIENESGDDFANQLNALAAPVSEREDPKARLHIGRELILPLPLHLRLDRHGLQRSDAGDALDQKGLVLGAALKFQLEPAAKDRRQGCRNPDIERERAR
jgi:hypothetical protein